MIDSTAVTHKVLDHGYVKYVGHMGTDETVIEAARMSTGKGFISWGPYEQCSGCNGVRVPSPDESAWLGGEFAGNRMCSHVFTMSRGDVGLLEFLYKNQHSTPFEMCELALEIQGPIMMFRELFRHRVLSINEFSARYAQMPNVHYLPELGRFQKQAIANKQGSADPLDPVAAERMQFYLRTEQKQVYDHYEDMIGEGLAKEVARLNTPVSRYSKARVKTNLRNWFGILNLRQRPNAQWEIQEFMKPAAAIIGQLWPRSYALFLEHDLNGMRLSATEAEIVRKFINSCGDDEQAVFHPQYEAVLKKFGAKVKT